MIEVLVEHERIQEYYNLVKKVEKEFEIDFEHEFYDRIYYWSVNDYLAVIEQPDKVLPIKDLNIKQKGSMLTNPPLGYSTDSLIIPKALVYYFVYGIPIEKTIKEETDIFLFCNCPKVNKKFTVIWMGEKQQQLNRYFVSNKGTYLYKQKEGGNLENMLKGFTVELLNDFNSTNAKDYSINYAYYISEARKLIKQVEPDQLKLF